MIQVAIYYDWLNTWGGAERVLLDLLTLYPQADLYTVQHVPKKTPWLKNSKIYTPSTFITKVKHLALISPLIPVFVEKFDFTKYELVISLTSMFGHCLITQPKTKFICYWLTPNRFLYSNNLFSLYRPIDKIFSSRPDTNISISKSISQKLSTTYGLKSQVVYPGVNTNFFQPSTTNKKQDYYLVVSRLVPYKQIDKAIVACQKARKKLVIIGTGRQESYLKSISSPKYISFVGNVSEEKLRGYYQNAKAFIMPQIEDFGISALEAQACGTPVIYLNQGGATETIQPESGISFDTYSVLVKLLENDEGLTIDPSKCRKNSLRFSKENFMINFNKAILHS